MMTINQLTYNKAFLGMQFRSTHAIATLTSFDKEGGIFNSVPLAKTFAPENFKFKWEGRGATDKNNYLCIQDWSDAFELVVEIEGFEI